MNTKLVYWDKLTQLCLDYFNFRFIEEDKIVNQNILIDENNEEVDYYSIYPIPITPIKTNYGNITQVNFCGDGTVEFQVNEESICWNEFENEELQEICNSIINAEKFF